MTLKLGSVDAMVEGRFGTANPTRFNAPGGGFAALLDPDPAGPEIKPKPSVDEVDPGVEVWFAWPLVASGTENDPIPVNGGEVIEGPADTTLARTFGEGL